MFNLTVYLHTLLSLVIMCYEIQRRGFIITILLIFFFDFSTRGFRNNITVFDYRTYNENRLKIYR